MKRKEFLTTSAGFLAIMTLPGVFSINCTRKSSARSFKFRDYRKGETFGNVKIVTPDDGYYIHTFYDIIPFSPSQKLLAVNKLPYQGGDIKYGDELDICIIDLENETIEKVYSTKGWGYQLGANLNWGKTDRYLYTNDIIDNQAVCVRIDLETKEIKAFAGPMYHIAPDESAVIGFPLDLINVTQMGYGVPYFKELEKIEGAPKDQGIWHTDLVTNEKKLLVSLYDVSQKASEPDFFKGGNFYFFHSKYNRQGTSILQVTRCIFPDDPSKRGVNAALYTFNQDGSGILQALTREHWSYGGHHPNWHPNGEYIIMNLTPKWLGEDELRFCTFDYAGKDFRILSSKNRGSGHPSVNPDSSYLVTDCYNHEPMALENGEVPIRLINLPADEEVYICTVFTRVDITKDVTYRIDPHPAWSRDYKKVCFNGSVNEKRQVFVADLTEVL